MTLDSDARSTNPRTPLPPRTPVASPPLAPTPPSHAPLGAAPPTSSVAPAVSCDSTAQPQPQSHSQRLRSAVVAGFGPVGRMVAERLESEGVAITVIDLNPKTVALQKGLGKRFIGGSAADPAVLHQAGIESAQALILTIPDEDQALQACREARKLRPDIYIAARTNYLSKGMLASKAGADYVIVEELLTAQAMHDAVFEHWVLPHQGVAGGGHGATNTCSSPSSSLPLDPTS